MHVQSINDAVIYNYADIIFLSVISVEMQLFSFEGEASIKISMKNLFNHRECPESSCWASKANLLWVLAPAASMNNLKGSKEISAVTCLHSPTTQWSGLSVVPRQSNWHYIVRRVEM